MSRPPVKLLPERSNLTSLVKMFYGMGPEKMLLPAVQQVSQVFKSSGKLSTERIAEVHKGCSIGDARWKAARLLQRLRTNSLGENKLLRIVPWSSFLCAKNAFQSCTVGGMLPDSWFLATAPRQAFAGSGDLQWSTCPGRVSYNGELPNSRALTCPTTTLVEDFQSQCSPSLEVCKDCPCHY
ncbi:uncharacterized protein LOC9635771 [Selaginella moellendorffii]|uniref:uncharacterized protein LOC9635771 n=1 Tax=Selaginella moellendorffii TaxID=88036 RepID=UPI000D1CE9BB|nr:uncharacterized protein LOC9635771 [Selaginella moellendorffii]|eukprot:XP_024527835.1 uncharacterized protein LOC9635771 [Selaginella moellendorffii]